MSYVPAVGEKASFWPVKKKARPGQAGPEKGRQRMVAFRLARASDLPAIVSLLADDPLGHRRERTDAAAFAAYAAAFREIEADPGNELLVALCDGKVAGCLQITYIPGLTSRPAPHAAWRRWFLSAAGRSPFPAPG